MKIVINTCFGNYRISDEALGVLGVEDTYDITRTDARLIALIEERGSEFVSGRFANLRVYDIPKDATDYDIYEYDGAETLLYVVDGKIHYASFY